MKFCLTPPTFLFLSDLSHPSPQGEGNEDCRKIGDKRFPNRLKEKKTNEKLLVLCKTSPPTPLLEERGAITFLTLKSFAG